MLDGPSQKEPIMSEQSHHAGVPDEAKLFTIAEFEKAFSLIMPIEEAREYASKAHDTVVIDGLEREWKLAADVLELLAMVSDDCAARVERIWGVTPDEGRMRRERIAKEIGLQG
jgi:hypothetical protein